MQQIKVFSRDLLGILILKDNFMVLHFNQFALEMFVDSSLVAEVRQNFRVLGNGEHDRNGFMDMEFSLNASLSQPIPSQVHDLLGSPATLDWHLGLGEDKLSPFELLSHFIHFLGVLVVVDTSNWLIGILKIFSGSFDLIKIEEHP